MGAGIEKLNLLNISNTLYIEDLAFTCCNSLKEVYLPENLVFLGDNAFADCANLEKVIIFPKDLRFATTIFKDCKNLKEIYAPEILIDNFKTNLNMKNLKAEFKTISQLPLDLLLDSKRTLKQINDIASSNNLSL